MSIIFSPHRIVLAMLVVGSLAPSRARAQHCHITPSAAPTADHGEASTDRPRAWWAVVSTQVTAGAGHVRDASTDFMRTTRSYQGAAVSLAIGWRRLAARAAIGGHRVDGHGTGVDDARVGASVTLTPARMAIAAGISTTIAFPTGDADAGRGMGHTMIAGGAWLRAARGRASIEAAAAYARALGDGAAHAAHLHGSDLWPLIDPMNAEEVLGDVTAAVAVVPSRLAVRAGVQAGVPIDRGTTRLAAALGARLERGTVAITATAAVPLAGDPFVARGQLEVAVRY